MGTNPTLRIDNYSNTAGDSPNFNFITARGTSTTPLATQSGDNLGQFAAAGYNGAAFPSSRVKVTFLATENWSATANGTAMTFATTKNGTTARTERMRIDNTGNVGIGTTTPAYPLSVNGVIQSATGGFRFPDGTTQTSAVPICTGGQNPMWKGSAWTCSTPSLSLGPGLLGNITNDALSLFTDATYLQLRVGDNCPIGSAIASINQNGTVVCQAVGDLLTSPDNSVTIGGTPTASTVALNPAVVQARVSRHLRGGHRHLRREGRRHGNLRD